MNSIADLVPGRTRDLGGFEVRRILPWGGGRMVGPFIFLDHMGPVSFAAGQGVDVRPHPHIGLATVTYLYEGELVHRDSLGSVQTIKPGDVNWMTAGRGIVHSERTGPELRASGHRIDGLQSWVALPLADEESEPGFFHHPVRELPSVERDGVALRLIAGKAFGMSSPVRVFSELFYADAQMQANSRLEGSAAYDERAVYVAKGEVQIGDEFIAAGTLALFAQGEAVTLASRAASRVALLGGAPLEGKRHMWWNFVSSSKEKIEQAKRDWKSDAFPKVPGDGEFTPLPER